MRSVKIKEVIDALEQVCASALTRKVIDNAGLQVGLTGGGSVRGFIVP